MKLIGITAPYIMSAFVVLLAAYWGLTRAFGAHPFWAQKIAVIGVPLGLVIAIAFQRRPKIKRLLGFGALLLLAAAMAHFGRLRFAASFAEDRLAGHFWFYGWIGVAAAGAAFVAALLSPRVRYE